MRKICLVVTMLMLWLFVSSGARTVAEDNKKDAAKNPFMTVEINGYGDREGRISIIDYRTYNNPGDTEFEIQDVIQLSSGQTGLANVVVTGKSEGITVDRDGNGQLIISGKTKEKTAFVKTQIEYLCPLEKRNGNLFEEKFDKGIILYSKPNKSNIYLKEMNMNFDLSRDSGKYDKSTIQVSGFDSGMNGLFKKYKLSRAKSVLPSLSWSTEKDEFKKDKFDKVVNVSLSLSYNIAGNSYKIITWSIIGILALSNILLWLRLLMRKGKEKFQGNMNSSFTTYK